MFKFFKSLQCLHFLCERLLVVDTYNSDVLTCLNAALGLSSKFTCKPIITGAVPIIQGWDMINLLNIAHQ